VAADIAEKAISIKENAANIPGDAGKDAAKSLRSIDVGTVDILKEAANITRGVVESNANLFANVTRDAAVGALLGSRDAVASALLGSSMPLVYLGENIINYIISEIFKKLANLNVVLKTAGDIFKRADDQVIKDLIFRATRRVFRALRPYLGRVPVVYEGIFSNDLNW
jgi:hypothetical protein